MNKRRFCYICGNTVSSRTIASWWCEHCQQTYYENPKPCVDIAIFNDKGEVLIATRGAEPWKGKYDLPGGFMDLGETTEQALWRELDEELGLHPDHITKPQLVQDWIGNYKTAHETYHNLVFTYWAQLTGDHQFEGSDDVASVAFMDIKKLTADQFSWPIYIEVLAQAAQYYQANSK